MNFLIFIGVKNLWASVKTVTAKKKKASTKFNRFRFRVPM